MKRYVALLRGINVGGNNPLPMKVFRKLLSDIGCKDVATYIQSGNAVFRHADNAQKISAAISSAIAAQFEFRPFVLVLSAETFFKIASANPYAAMVIEPKNVHVGFLADKARDADVKRMMEIASQEEQFTLTDSAFYLCAPNGIGRSRLASNVEKCLGVQVTARNWRSVCKIEEMLNALG